MKANHIVTLGTILLISLANSVGATDLDLAKDYYRHRLTDKSKDILLTILNSKNTEADKACALQLLGEISYSEGNYSTAIEDWNTLLKRYPKSTSAEKIRDKISILSSSLKKAEASSSDNLIAKNYLENGDFFSDKANDPFSIDTSWLSKSDIAISWYDRVIREFPKTDYAEVAYVRKIKTILGQADEKRKEDLSNAESSWDRLQAYNNATKQLQDDLPTAEDCYADFEKEYPESNFRPALRFQIAQGFWAVKDYDNAEIWFDKLIKDGGATPSFYVETAKARLKKLKH